MPLILNIETATDICSVCISEGDKVLAIKEADKAFSHTSKLTVLIGACCEELGISLAQLDAVAVSKGPGSYTSLRVGASTAKGICYALDKPLIAVDTLRSIAGITQANTKKQGLFAPMIDARRMEVYVTLFDKNLDLTMDTQAKIIDRDSFKEYFDQGQTIVFSGNGANKCQDVINSPLAVFSPEICSAANLVSLSYKAFQKNDFCDAAYFSPNYFKSPNITTPRKTL